MQDKLRDIGLLLLRLGVPGLMISQHGLAKLLSFSDKAATFADPLGVGSATSLTLAVFGEVIAPALLVVGFFTRLAAIPAAFTMLVAAFVMHADDPFSKKEFALLFAIPFLVLALTGAGKYSLDQRYRNKS